LTFNLNFRQTILSFAGYGGVPLHIRPSEWIVGVSFRSRTPVSIPAPPIYFLIRLEIGFIHDQLPVCIHVIRLDLLETGVPPFGDSVGAAVFDCRRGHGVLESEWSLAFPFLVWGIRNAAYLEIARKGTILFHTGSLASLKVSNLKTQGEECEGAFETYHCHRIFLI